MAQHKSPYSRINPPPCGFCERAAVLTSGRELYQGKYRELFGVQFWVCTPCGAWVGTHRNTDAVPLGTLANKETRLWRARAHDAFDPLWRRKMRRIGNKRLARTRGYKWLAQQLGVNFHDCHIGHFDIAMCMRVVEVCAPYHIEGSGGINGTAK